MQGKITEEYAGFMKLRICGNQGLLLCAKERTTLYKSVLKSSESN